MSNPRPDHTPRPDEVDPEEGNEPDGTPVKNPSGQASTAASSAKGFMSMNSDPAFADGAAIAEAPDVEVASDAKAPAGAAAAAAANQAQN